MVKLMDKHLQVESKSSVTCNDRYSIDHTTGLGKRL